MAGKSNINKMEARILVIVFGPTLICPGDDSTVTMVTDMSHQCRIVETLIDKVDFSFPPDQDQVIQDTLDPIRPGTQVRLKANTEENNKQLFVVFNFGHREGNRTERRTTGRLPDDDRTNGGNRVTSSDS